MVIIAIEHVYYMKLTNSPVENPQNKIHVGILGKKCFETFINLIWVSRIKKKVCQAVF